MGVPSCITEELLLQDDIVIETTRMIKWNNNTKLANHTYMVTVVLTGKEQYARINQRVRRLCERASTVLQLPEIRPPRQDLQVWTSCKDNKQWTRKCANFGQEHVTTIRLCPMRMDAEKKAKAAPANHSQTGQRETSSYTIGKRMGHISSTGKWRNGPFHDNHQFP